VRVCFGILGLGGIDEAEEFVEFEGFGGLGEQGFQLGGGFWIVASFVLGYGCLEFLVEGLN